MNIIYYIVYVLYKGYKKFNPPNYNNFAQLVGGVVFLNLLILFILIDILSPHSRKIFPQNKFLLVLVAAGIYAVHLYLFRNKEWWLNKFAQLDQLPKKSNILFTTLTCVFFAFVLIYCAYRFIHHITH